MNLRWDPYFFVEPPRFASFWKDRLSNPEHKVLYVLGGGFDPRMRYGPAALLDAAPRGTVSLLRIDFDEGEGSSSPQLENRVQSNITALGQLAAGRATLEAKALPIWSGDGMARRRIGGLGATKLIGPESRLEEFDDVIVDISAIPRSIYFPMIGKLLALSDERAGAGQGASRLNIHVLVCEDPTIDHQIHPTAPDDSAAYVHGFGAGVQMDAIEGVPKVWIPILGEGQKGKLQRIFEHVTPDEICPVVPAPSKSPRRADDLLLEYRELLFDEWRVEPRNIIYSSEANPFETYRQLRFTAEHYLDALKPLRGCRIILSATSSKLLSLGVLLAAYELRQASAPVGVCQVDSQGYEFDPTTTSSATSGDLYSLWLNGEPYEA